MAIIIRESIIIVPAKDTKGTADESDDVIGMYNLVSGTFLPPATGTFTGGGVYAGEGGRIVNTSTTLSELRMNVAAGATVENDAVSIAGKVKLVKAGEGTFVASQYKQTYAGGTDVEGGVLKAGTYGISQPFGLCNDNLLFNGSFDAGSITNGSNYMYAFSPKWPENPGWTCDGHNAGISTANGTWVNTGYDIAASMRCTCGRMELMRRLARRTPSRRSALPTPANTGSRLPTWPFQLMIARARRCGRISSMVARRI